MEHYKHDFSEAVRFCNTSKSYLHLQGILGTKLWHQCHQQNTKYHCQEPFRQLQPIAMNAYSSSSSRSSSRSSIASFSNLMRFSAPAVRQCLNIVQQLFYQTATNKVLTMASATPIGSRTNGPGVICLRLPTFAYNFYGPLTSMLLSEASQESGQSISTQILTSLPCNNSSV